MTSATLPNGQTVNYGYDALGRRSARTTNGSTTNFIYDGADVIQDKQGANQTNYLNGAGVDDKLRISSAQTGNLYFLTDHLGSTQGLTGVSGNVAEWQRYTPFGESDVSNSLTRYGFTGREKDTDTNLIYYRARWYDAEQGRFISQDPIGFEGGNTNLYAYVSNNPISKTDPSGLYEIDVHYYATHFLAQMTGCFTGNQARLIADGNQSTDENPNTTPGLGEYNKNTLYHALHDGAAQGVGAPDLWAASLRGNANYVGLGRYLHYLQDTFSHATYNNSNYGHLFGTHKTDKTATNPEKTLRMAKSTFEAIKNWAKAKNCKCGNKWDNSWDDIINRFAKIETNHPSLSTIDANRFNPDELSLEFPPFFLGGDLRALRMKALILGVPMR
jgi:RHS repeat-associated protein